MKLACSCGNVIFDTGNPISCKASLMPDQDRETFWDRLSSGVAALIAATRAGRRVEWLRQHESLAPPEVSDDDAVFHFATRLSHRYTRTVYQCDRCERLFLDDPADPSRVLSFVPEDPAAARDVLASHQPSSE